LNSQQSTIKRDVSPQKLEPAKMRTPNGQLKLKRQWRTISSVMCLLVFSASALPQSESRNGALANLSQKKIGAVEGSAAEAQRRLFAVSLVISLATEAKSYDDLALRPRVLAKAADVLWNADNLTARALFIRAWEAAEAGDAEGVTTNTKDKPPAMVIALRKLSGRDLRVEVLSLVSRRDKPLAEQFLAKLQSETQREAGDEKNSAGPRNVFSGPEANLKRLLIANKLLADGEVTAAREFALPALTDVNSGSIGFLSQLRTRDAVSADQIFGDLLARSEVDPLVDANTVSGLSSYAFTPGFYVVFWADGHSTWNQPEGPIVAPDLPASLRARFFQVGANVLLRPALPSDQDTTSCGSRGRLKVITRLLPLFEQYAPDSAIALRTQLTASSARNIDRDDPLITEGVRPEAGTDFESVQQALDRARSSAERDQIYAAAATRFAPTGNKRARDFADSIADAKFRAQVRNYVDLELVRFAIRKKESAAVVQLASAGELSHIQRSWAYTQAARLLESEHERALDLLQKATDEAARIDAGDPDASLAMIGIANQLLASDRVRVWELLNKTVKLANSTQEFTGDEIASPKSSMLVTRSGTKFIHLPNGDFNLSRALRVLADEDLVRSVELAKSFKYESARANATLAIARAVLEKPAAMTAKN
jgi:hypothetical protein